MDGGAKEYSNELQQETTMNINNKHFLQLDTGYCDFSFLLLKMTVVTEFWSFDFGYFLFENRNHTILVIGEKNRLVSQQIHQFFMTQSMELCVR